MKEFGFKFEQEIVKSAKPAQSGEFSIWAYASTYDVDSDDCQITRTALEAAKDDLLKYNTVLFNHDYNRPVGRVVETKIDSKGLLVRIIISASESDLISKIQDGTLSKLSISGRVQDWAQTVEDEKGRSILQITKIKLFEVSIVSVPANVEAKTISSSIVKSLVIAKMQANDTEKSLIADLQLLAGRLVGDDKAVVDHVLEFFKSNDTQKMEKNIKQYSFEDTDDNRPVFQINSVSNSPVELSENNTFRKQLLKKGKWYHWAADGGVLELTDEKLDEIVKNFNDGLLESVPVPLTHTNDPSKNTGVVKELIRTKDGIDAILEIKEEKIVDKIKKGLITAISASLDPNYMIKKTKKFAGAVLLHAALVAEPYIKGLGKFVALSDEFDGREIIQLEDGEFDIKESLNTVFSLLKDIQDHIAADEEDKEAEEDSHEEEAEEGETNEDLEKSKCTLSNGEEGQLVDGECIAKNVEKELEEEKSVVEDSSETAETKVDEVEEDKSETVESDEESVDLSDSVELYEKYLKAGKIVPAGKTAFIALCDTLRTIQLSDSSVDVSALLSKFLESQPTVVNFSEDGTVEDPAEEKPAEAEAEDEIPDAVKDFYMNRMNLSEEATKKAWADAKTSYDAKASQKSTLFS